MQHQFVLSAVEGQVEFVCLSPMVKSMVAAGCRTLERLDIRMSGVAEDEEVAIADTLLNRLQEQALKK